MAATTMTTTSRGTRKFVPRTKAPAEPAVQPVVRQDATRFVGVGTPVTLRLPDECCPYVVVEVRAGGRVLVLEEVAAVSADNGYSPTEHHNGHPVWDHTYAEGEIARLRTGRTVKAVKRNGVYYVKDARIVTGFARYYRDFSR